ncbi:MAG: alpha/beta hydrolase [Cellulomonadaceae bacterium]
MVIYHPADSPARTGRPLRVLFLLHGMLDGCETWITRTTIAMLAEEHDLFVVMPEGQRSYWRDLVSGGNFHSYLTQELPTVVAEMFGIAHERILWAVAGNSMGGYGALYTALSRPDLFSACGAFSPVIDPVAATGLIPGELLIDGETDALFGAGNHAGARTDVELVELARRVGGRVRMDVWCGDQDFLYESNRGFHQALDAATVPHRFDVVAGGGHEWVLWDAACREFVSRWFADGPQGVACSR